MKRVNGITYLKAFLPFMVIAWHARFLGTSGIMRVQDVYIPSVVDVIYLNIINLAVPLFFLISFYLYLMKRKTVEDKGKYLFKRIVYLLELFVIWRAIYIVFGIGNLWIPERGIVMNLYHLFFGGGDTLLYYLELLIYFMILIELICLLCERCKLSIVRMAYFGLVFSLLLIVLCYFIPGVIKYEALRYFSPIAFLPLVFIAFLLADTKQLPVKWIIVLFVSGIALAVFEWRCCIDQQYITQGGYAIATPIYARLSQIIIAASVFMLALNVQKEPSKAVKWLASVSLYAYCLHQIIIVIADRLLPVSEFIIFLLTIVCTYVLSAVIHKTKQFISIKSKNDSSI